MSVFSLKLGSTEMVQKLAPLLQQGEELTAAVFCSLQHSTPLTVSSVFLCYLGITDRHRLIGCEFSLFGEKPFAVHLQDVTKLRIKTGILNQYLFRLESEYLTLNCRIGRDAGKKFPDQSESLDRIISILEQYQR